MLVLSLFKAPVLETVRILIRMGVFGRWNANTGRGYADVGNWFHIHAFILFHSSQDDLTRLQLEFGF